MPKIDLERLRRETRGCADLILLDNAGASLPPAPVADALYDYLRDEELHGGYAVMERRREELEHFYAAAARLLNCAATEVAFADSATRAWNAIFYAFDFNPGDRVLVGSMEYGSSLVALLHRARRDGIELVAIPDTPSGEVDMDALADLLDARVKLVCLTLVPSGNGLVNPAAGVGRLARAAGIPFLLDACQGLGQLPVDVETIGCDALCGTGRKFLRGPRGSGLLYVRQALLERLEPAELNHHAVDLEGTRAYTLRPDARRFECWERSCAAQLALGVAIDYALEIGLEAIRDRVQGLAARLREGLAALDGVSVTDLGHERSAIVTCHTRQLPAAQLHKRLAAAGIASAVTGPNANPLHHRRSHLPDLLRLSPHCYNSENEIDTCLLSLKQILTPTGA